MKKMQAPWIMDPAWVVRQNPDSVYYRSHGGRRGEGKEYFALPSGQRRELPWAEVRKHGWKRLREFLDDLSECQSALAGYIAYEAGFAFEKRWQHLPVPEDGYAVRFSLIDCWHEQDFKSRSAYYCRVDAAPSQGLDKLQNAIEPHADKIFGGTDTQLYSRSLQAEDFADSSPKAYGMAVRKILDDLFAGRYYELNFTQGFTLEQLRHGADIFMRAMKRLDPAQAFYSSWPNEEIISASPELFLRRTGGIIETRPIKGSVSCTEGAAFPLDEKLAAEHVMVVDLARNDLGRICDTGSIKVEGLLSPTRFGSIAHLETGISGKSSASIGAILQACFPAASITGAPKIEVVKAIAEYEPRPRGIYTGSCGWLFPDGDFDLNVAIRTITGTMAAKGWKYKIGAGGAIVSDSDPESEYAELLMKVSPIIDVLVNSSGGSVLNFR